MPRVWSAANGAFVGALLLVWIMLAAGPGYAGAADSMAVAALTDREATATVAGSAELTYTLFFPVMALAPERLPVFGVESKTPITGGILDQRLKDLGAGWERLGTGRVSWRSLQPDEGGPIQWELLADLEAELRLLRTRRIQPRVVIEDSPRWATVAETSCSAVRIDKLGAFASFVGALAARYGSEEFGVHDWEFGNEPDVDPSLVPVDSGFGCWGDIDDPYYGGRHYGEMLKVVGPALRSADASARLWVGGLLLDSALTTDPSRGRPELFLQGILEAGAAPWFDVVAYHTYVPYQNIRVDHDNAFNDSWYSRGGRTVGKAAFLREIMSAYGVSKPLVLNETGLMCSELKPWCPPDDTYLDYQADHLVRSFVRGLSAGVAGFAWYTLEAPGWRWSSLLDDAANPRPSYVAYQELIRQLRRSTPVGAVDYGPDLEAHAFRRAGKATHVVWAKVDQVYQVEVPRARFVQARDRAGAPVALLVTDEVCRLTVGFSPVYIEVTE